MFMNLIKSENYILIKGDCMDDKLFDKICWMSETLMVDLLLLQKLKDLNIEEVDRILDEFKEKWEEINRKYGLKHSDIKLS